jgi:hypothetical protein
MDIWTREKLVAKSKAKSSFVILDNKQETSLPPNLLPVLVNPPDKTALVPRAEQENSDVNTDLEANLSDNDPSSPSSDADAIREALLYNDRFVETVRSIAGLVDHTVYLCLRHFEPLTRSFASLLDAITALLQYLPDLSKDIMNFFNRLFDALLRFVSDFFAEAVPRTIESVSTPLGSTGVEFGKGFVHLVTMTLSTLVKLVRMFLRVGMLLLGAGMVAALVFWFTGGKEVVRTLLVVAPNGKE